MLSLSLHSLRIDQFGFKSMASAIPGGLPRQTKDDAMPQAYTCSWTKAVHSLKYSSFVMLLEAPQIWRMKRYNVLETELVYTHSVTNLRFSSDPRVLTVRVGLLRLLKSTKHTKNKYDIMWNTFLRVIFCFQIRRSYPSTEKDKR